MYSLEVGPVPKFRANIFQPYEVTGVGIAQRRFRVSELQKTLKLNLHLQQAEPFLKGIQHP